MDAEEMTIAFMIFFILEGFSAETVGFSSTYYATTCSELGWGIWERIQLDMVPDA